MRLRLITNTCVVKDQEGIGVVWHYLNLSGLLFVGRDQRMPICGSKIMEDIIKECSEKELRFGLGACQGASYKKREEVHDGRRTIDFGRK